MLSNIKNSIKARLYDMKYTPFLTSYGFSWIYFNAKVFLIYFEEKLDVQQKIELLSYKDINYCYPLYFALFYVFVFPALQWLFYAVTLFYKREMNSLKHKIEKETLLSAKESKDIRYANLKIQEELDEYIKKYEDVKKEYDEYKIQLEKELNASFESKVEDATEKLKQKLHSANSTIANKDTELGFLQQELVLLKPKQEQNKFNKQEIQKVVSRSKSKSIDKNFEDIISSLSNNEEEVLEVFYENDKQDKNTFKNIILDKKNMQRATSEHAIRSLKEKKLVEEKSIFVSLTDLGLDVVNKLFSSNANG